MDTLLSASSPRANATNPAFLYERSGIAAGPDNHILPSRPTLSFSPRLHNAASRRGLSVCTAVTYAARITVWQATMGQGCCHSQTPYRQGKEHLLRLEDSVKAWILIRGQETTAPFIPLGDSVDASPLGLAGCYKWISKYIVPHSLLFTPRPRY
jgi:hypothetical protein